MLPILCDKTTVSVFRPNKYTPGDVIVFKYKGTILIHRVLRIKSDRFYAKGDNSFRIEDFTEEAILGKAIIPNDTNNSEEFLNASWNIGILFKKAGYQKETVVNTEEYHKYKKEHIDSTIAKQQIIKMRGAFFYANTPLPNNCPYAIIKGEPLSLLAYSKCGRRISQDIDILIPKQSLEEIENFFKNNGFEESSSNRMKKVFAVTKSHQTLPLYKKTKTFGDIIIDLNFDVFWGEYEGKRIDILDFLSDCIEINVYGKSVKTLSPIKAFISLALHHYKDMNSLYLLATRNSINFFQFQDIYCLLINNQNDITVNNLYELSKQYEILPYIYYILYYTYQVFKDPVLKPYLKELYTTEGEQLLNCYGLCSKEKKEWKIDFETRLQINDLFPFIKNDLTESDLLKIQMNKNVFS